MRHALTSFAVVLVSTGVLAARAESPPGPGEGRVYVGRLDPHIQPDALGTIVALTPVPQEEWASLPELPAFEDRVFRGTAYHVGTGADLALVLVESSTAPVALYLDLNSDARWDPGERFGFAPSPEPHLSYEVIVPLQLWPGADQPFPVRFALDASLDQRLLRGRHHPLIQSLSAFMTGEVRVEGQSYRVRVPYSAQAGGIDLENGRIGLDIDRDGVIEDHTFSREMEFARGESVVFRLGARFVAFDYADASILTIALRERPASAYRRIEAHVGDVVPDVVFEDLDGRVRHLREFAGRYVLLDFCELDCAPCRWEIPTLVEAYARFEHVGFDLISFNVDDDPARLRRVIRDHGMAWTHAPSSSAGPVSRNRFRIHAYPSRLLIDPTGRVVSAGRPGELPLREDALLTTLETVLRAQTTQP